MNETETERRVRNDSLVGQAISETHQLLAKHGIKDHPLNWELLYTEARAPWWRQQLRTALKKLARPGLIFADDETIAIEGALEIALDQDTVSINIKATSVCAPADQQWVVEGSGSSTTCVRGLLSAPIFAGAQIDVDAANCSIAVQWRQRTSFPLVLLLSDEPARSPIVLQASPTPEGLQATFTNIAPGRYLLTLFPDRTNYDFLPPAEWWGDYLADSRRDFCGRQWVFDEINAWLKDATQPKLLWILGEPGMGKTALVAELIARNENQQVLAYHCCRGNQASSRDPAWLVRNLAAMLARRLPGYAAGFIDGYIDGYSDGYNDGDAYWLAKPHVREALTEIECAQNPKQSFQTAILDALADRKDLAPGYLLIDALEEGVASSLEWIHLLRRVCEGLPANVRVLVTNRQAPQEFGLMGQIAPKELTLDDERSGADVEKYLQFRLQTEPRSLRNVLVARRLRGNGENPVNLELLIEKTRRNFLYLRYALDRLAEGAITVDEWPQLPSRVEGLYETLFLRYFPLHQGEPTGYDNPRRLFAALLAAPAPLTDEQLTEAAGLSPYEFRRAMGMLDAYLPKRNRCREIFHSSFAHWLEARERNPHFYVEQPRVKYNNPHDTLVVSAQDTWRGLPETIMDPSDETRISIKGDQRSTCYSMEELLKEIVRILREALQQERPQDSSWELVQRYRDPEVSGNRTPALLEAYIPEWHGFSDSLTQKISISDELTVEEVARYVIHYTYNKRRRRKYQDEKFEHQVHENANVRDADAVWKSIDVPDRKLLLDSLMEIKDVIETLVENYSALDRRIIELKLSNYRANEIKGTICREFPDTQIADVKISRVWSRFLDEMRGLFAEE